MGVLQIITDEPGQINQPNVRRVKIISSDNLATVTAAGYLNPGVLQGYYINNTDIIDMWYGATGNANVINNPGSYAEFTASIANGVITLAEVVPPGGVVVVGTPTTGHIARFAGASSIQDGGVLGLAAAKSVSDNTKASVASVSGATVIGNLASFADITGTVQDSGIASSSVILSTVAAGQTVNASSSSATPGTIRALTGKMTESNSVMTSGNVVGVRGEVDCVGASGGFIYGVQGKVIPTGTLSGSLWCPAVFGQFDVSAATINGAQLAALWGDWGTTGATDTDLTGCRGIAFTNTTANVLNAQDYRYGNATYLMELAGAGGTLNYYLDAGTSAGSAGDAAHCAAQKVLKLEINGVAVYIPVFTQNT